MKQYLHIINLYMIETLYGYFRRNWSHNDCHYKTTISEIETTIYKLSWSDRKYQMCEMLPTITKMLPKITDTRIFHPGSVPIHTLYSYWNLPTMATSL